MRLGCETHDARRVDSDERPAPLLRLAGDEYRLDVARIHKIDHGAEGIAHRPKIEAVGPEHNDVGILARREHADLRIEIGATGALKGREFEHLAAGEKRWNILLVAHSKIG